MSVGRRSQQPWFVAGLAIVLTVSIAAWTVGSRVQSSSQAAARAQPPVASLITAPVEFQVLSTTLITRADVVAAGSVAVAGPTLSPETASGAGVVTGVFVSRGEQVVAGEPIVEVAGRPVIVLVGKTPAFRAMRPGISGSDVAQLQAALVGAGCEAGASGTYDGATKQCVEQFYIDAGYTAMPSSDTETGDLIAAQTAVAEAEDALEVAQSQVGNSVSRGGNAAATAAQAQLNAAQRAHDSAIEERPILVDTSTRDADDAVATAAGATSVAQTSLDVVRADPEATADAVLAAQVAVTDAQRAYDNAVAARPGLIATATRNADTAVAFTGDALATAHMALTEADTDPNSSMQGLAVEQQERAVERARQALTDLEATTGAVVPFGEIVFLPELPARVDAVNAVVGASTADLTGESAVGGPSTLVVLSSSTLEARLSIPQTDQALIQEGTPVELLYEATGEVIAGTVRTIGTDLEPSAETAVPSYPVVVDAAIPENWSGLNLRATFTSTSTENEVLVVPAAAVSSSADGQTRVQVERSDGTVDLVTVKVGLSADGFVEVATDEAGGLAPGDLVVTG